MAARIVGVVGMGLLCASLAPLACSSFSGSPAPDAPDASTSDPDGASTGIPGTSDLGIEVQIGDTASPSFVVQGDHVNVPVKLTRKTGSQGPVNITISGALPDNVKVDALMIPAKANEGTLVLSADAAAVQAKFLVKVLANEVDGASALGELNGFVRGKPGAVDTTFGDAGLLRHIFGGGKNTTAQDLAVLDDDHIVAVALCGTSTTSACLRRASADGMLDTSYGSGGIAALPFLPSQIADGGKGRVLVAGNGGAYQVRLGRLDNTGKGDPTFGNGTGEFQGTVSVGTVPPIGPAEGSPVTLAVKNDGNLAVGFTAFTSGGNVHNFAATRFDPSGTPVATFGNTNGFSVGPAISSKPTTIGFLATGDFWLVGIADGVGSGPGGSQTARLDSTGMTYVLTTPVVPVSQGAALGLNSSIAMADGAILSAANDGTSVGVGKTTPDGLARDIAWGNSGIQTITQNAIPSLSLSADGRQAIVTLQEPGGIRFTRLTPNGAPDVTFGENGVVIHSFGNQQVVECARTQRDGRILVLSTELFSDGTDVAITRYWD